MAVALVTGGCGTIGAAIALALHEDGHAVRVLDRAMVEPARRLDGVEYAQVDLIDEDAVAQLIGGIASHAGIAALVNAAGIVSTEGLAQSSAREMRQLFETNVLTAYFATRSVLPGMVARRYGRIVNLSSLAGKTGGRLVGVSYAVSKAAMNGLTMSVAREYAATGITCNAVAPAMVASPMMLGIADEAKIAAMVPVGRLCQPEEVGRAVAFLCSEHAGFITGEILDMNGGIHVD